MTYIMTERSIGLCALRLAIVLTALVSQDYFAQSNSCVGPQIFKSSMCDGDSVSADEKALFEIVNKYRAANGRAELRLSEPLSKVANRRMLDLRQNLKVLTHSWSNCSYDVKDEKTWPCVTDAPKRLNSGYGGQGYETLFRTALGRALPVSALDAWKKSPLHNSIILNLEAFKDLEWEEFGVAIDGQFAALWFGNSAGPAKKLGIDAAGLGVSYDQAVKGLAKLLTIDQTSSTIQNNRWQGFSPDRRIKLEIYGTKKEISEANLGITIKLEPDNTLAPKNRLAVITLLRNVFPEWQDRDAWFDSSVSSILADNSASRTKLVRKITVELRSVAGNSLSLEIRPESKPKYIEIY